MRLLSSSSRGTLAQREGLSRHAGPLLPAGAEEAAEAGLGQRGGQRHRLAVHAAVHRRQVGATAALHSGSASFLLLFDLLLRRHAMFLVSPFVSLLMKEPVRSQLTMLRLNGDSVARLHTVTHLWIWTAAFISSSTWSTCTFVAPSPTSFTSTSTYYTFCSLYTNWFQPPSSPRPPLAPPPSPTSTSAYCHPNLQLCQLTHF